MAATTTNYFKCSKVSKDIIDCEAFFFDDKDAASIEAAYLQAQAHAASLRRETKRAPRIVAYKRPAIVGSWTGQIAVVGESSFGLEVLT